MKKKIFVSLLCLLIGIPLFAVETFDAEILVTDFDEVPVSEMDVLLFDDKGTLIHSANTGSKGSFNLTLSAGDYKIQLKEAGELKKEAPLHIPELEGRKIYNHVRIQVLYEARDKFEIENLNFETNSAAIMTESYEALNKLALFLNSESESKFVIEGHTDSDGSEKSNAELSLARAQAVKDYLIAQGVKSVQLETKGFGESMPVESNDTDKGKAANRRTEIRKVIE